MKLNMQYESIDGNSEKEEDRMLVKYFGYGGFRQYGLYGENRLCLPSTFKGIYQRIKDFEVRDDDVYVISFMKAGTTWTQEMVWLLGNDLNYEAAKKDVVIRFPFIECQALIPDLRFLQLIEMDPIYSTAFHESISYIENLPSPRFIKSHLPWEFLPDQITKGIKKPKVIIYPARNVKDCIVSNYYHCVMFDGFEGSFSDFFKMFLADRAVYTPYWPHILEFWKRRHDENILFIRYEDMKKDLMSVIEKMCSFLGKKYTEDELKVLAEHLNFKNMKENKAVNYEATLQISRTLRNSQDKHSFLRSGKVGDYKTHMTSEQIAQIDKLTEESVKGTEYVD